MNNQTKMDGQSNQQGGVDMIDKMIEKLSWQGPGQSYSETGKRNPVRDDTQNLLTMATTLYRPKKILELGTAFGLSGMCLLRGAPLAELTTIEFFPEAAEEAQQNFAQAKVGVNVIAGEAGEVIKTLKGHFDMVFIDHAKDKYLPHFHALLERGLIGSGTLILADNVIDRFEECRDFVNHMQVTYPMTKIIDTECGLLVAII